MRSRDERRAEFERREVERKARYAEARARLKAKAAQREDARRPAVVEVEPVAELSEREQDDAARWRLAHPGTYGGDGIGGAFILSTQVRELKQAAADLKRLREARDRGDV